MITEVATLYYVECPFSDKKNIRLAKNQNIMVGEFQDGG
jgi:hypothetical protein